MPLPTDSKTDKRMRFLIFALLIAGAVLRLYVYLQNRDLIIDEANVARNIYERGFMALLSPLDYQQYAPPIFLWTTKLSTLLLGMGEPALKLYPLLCGMGALWLMYRLLKVYLPVQAMWYPASLLAFSPMMIRYATELKQYMPDVFIALLLVWLALNISINTMSRLRFAMLWILIGTIVIWSSMPSVFMLAGVGCYYGWQLLQTKQYKMIILPAIISLVWVMQFVLYYLLMLQEQANSDYLQNFHQYDFLFATPSTKEEWDHNWHVFSELMIRFEGYYPYVHNINTAFLIIGTIMLVRKATAKSVLLIIPVLALCAAAALNQFSMMARVSLFIIPILMIIIGYGFAQYTYLKSVWLRGIVIIAGLYAAGCNIAYLAEEPFKYEELTEGMHFARDRKVPGDRVFLYHSSVPSFIYYTTIHPGKDDWGDMKDAHPLVYETNYDSLGAWLNYSLQPTQEAVFIYTNATESEFEHRNKQPKPHLETADSLIQPWIRAWMFRKRS